MYSSSRNVHSTTTFIFLETENKFLKIKFTTHINHNTIYPYHPYTTQFWLSSNRHFTRNASNVERVENHSIPLTVARVPTKTFTAKVWQIYFYKINQPCRRSLKQKQKIWWVGFCNYIFTLDSSFSQDINPQFDKIKIYPKHFTHCIIHNNFHRIFLTKSMNEKAISTQKNCELTFRFCELFIVCYGKAFGPHGYGYGKGAGTLQSDTYQQE